MVGSNLVRGGTAWTAGTLALTLIETAADAAGPRISFVNQTITDDSDVPVQWDDSPIGSTAAAPSGGGMIASWNGTGSGAASFTQVRLNAPIGDNMKVHVDLSANAYFYSYGLCGVANSLMNMDAPAGGDLNAYVYCPYYGNVGANNNTYTVDTGVIVQNNNEKFGIEIDTTVGSRGWYVVKGTGGATIRSPKMNLPDGAVYVFVTVNSSEMVWTVDAVAPYATDVQATFTDIPPPSGGGGSTISAATRNDMLDALGNAVGGEVINLTTDALDYGTITLNNKNFASPVTIQYTGSGTKPKLGYVNLNNCSGLIFRKIEFTTATPGNALVVATNGCHDLTFDINEFDGQCTRNGTTGVITYVASGLNFVDAYNINVTGGTMHHCAGGIGIVRTHHATITTIAISDHYGDGIDYSGVGCHDISIIGVAFTTFYSAPGDHADCIQVFTLNSIGWKYYNVNVLNCTFVRGAGDAPQG